MNEVLLKRLVGACALVGFTLVLANLLPAPSALPQPEKAASRVAYDLRPPAPPAAEQASAVATPLPTAAPPVPIEQTLSPPLIADAAPAAKPGPEPRDADSPKPGVAPVAKSEAAPKPSVPAPKRSAPAPKPKPPAATPAQIAKVEAAPKPDEPVDTPKVQEPSKPDEPKPVDAPKVQEPQPASASETWFVQIGAFAKEANAQQSLARLKKAGLKAQQDILEWKSGTRYRVRCGPFASKNEAEAERARAAGMGFGDARLAREPAG